MKKMKNISIAICCLLGFILSFNSCDYLDVVPDEQPTVKDGFQDPQKSLGFLHSCYSDLNNLNPMSYTREDVSSTDEYVMPYQWNHRPQQVAWDAINSGAIGDWTWAYGGYNGIRQCYLFLDGIQTAPRVTDAQKNEWSAEAKFLIAYYHFSILRKYGPCPIVDEAYNPNIALPDMPGRSHFDYVVDYIVNMLDEATPNLPADRISSEWGRASQVIAKALKARILLYAASPLWNGNTDYANFTNKNFETPGYGLELVSQTFDANKWERARKACQEAFDFARQLGYELYKPTSFPELSGMPDGPEKEFKTHVLRMQYLVTTRPNDTDNNKEIIFGLPSQGSITAQWPHRILQKSNGDWVSGYSGIAPTLNAVESFYTENGYLPDEDPAFYPKNEWFQRAEASSDIIKLHKKREPRFYAWIAFDGGEYGVKMKQGQPVTLNFKNSQSHGYNPDLFNRDNTPTGYLSQKYIHPRLEITSTGSNNSGQLNAHRPVIRLAELYLSLAEAQVMVSEHLGTNYMNDALDNLNEIRDRAGIPKLTMAEFQTDPMKWIRNERFVEFYQEGLRYYDVRRWKLGEQYFGGPYYGLNAISKKDPTFSEFNQKVEILGQNIKFSQRLYLMPLFHNEVYKNPQLIQAPGY